eukprot:TRINITY_DN62627_c0_g1_i1.p2 TRINITY_DN62627_c0_g1~~TRINITY_DN62627_c0_g1_i1.p2  ORF type:complete len:172 (+),score=11.85 TRINITY_DN62627_c0_g1_i1:145-660(+)
MDSCCAYADHHAPAVAAGYYPTPLSDSRGSTVASNATSGVPTIGSSTSTRIAPLELPEEGCGAASTVVGPMSRASLPTPSCATGSRGFVPDTKGRYSEGVGVVETPYWTASTISSSGNTRGSSRSTSPRSSRQIVPYEKADTLSERVRSPAPANTGSIHIEFSHNIICSIQ